MILKGKEAFYMKGELPKDFSSKCPKCRKISKARELISEDGVRCPDCERVATIKIIEDTGFISWTCGIDKGRLEIKQLPELPSELRSRLQKEYSISKEESEKLCSSRKRADLFEEIAEEIKPSLASTFVVDTLVREVKYRDITVEKFKQKGIVKLLKDYSEEKITWDILEDILRESLEKEKTVQEIYKSQNYSKFEEESLKEICQEVIEEEEEAVEDYKQGGSGAINYLIGKVKQKTQGAADAQEARKFLKEILD